MKMSRSGGKLFLSADSGGSKTDWRWLDSEGTTVQRIVTAGMASLHAGMMPVEECVRKVAEAMPGVSLGGIYFSLGGPNVEEIHDALTKAWPNTVISVGREASGELVESCRHFVKCDGVVMGGTGVTAVGFQSDGTRRFAEGWGPVFGDFGSGGWIGLTAAQTFLRGVDGTVDAGRLPNLFAVFTEGLDISNFTGRMELKARINALSRRELAAFAPRVMALADNGDNVAHGIISVSANEMARHLRRLLCRRL